MSLDRYEAVKVIIKIKREVAEFRLEMLKALRVERLRREYLEQRVKELEADSLFMREEVG